MWKLRNIESVHMIQRIEIIQEFYKKYFRPFLWIFTNFVTMNAVITLRRVIH